MFRRCVALSVGALLAATASGPTGTLTADPSSGSTPSPTQSAAPTRPLRILAEGDSITYGWPDGPAVGYPPQLGRALNLSGVATTVINRSVPGATSADIMPWAAGEVALNQPDLLVLDIGTNDAAKLPSGFEARYQQLTASIFAAKPGVTIVASFIQYSAPSLGWGPAEQAVNDAIFRTVYQAVNGVAVLRPGFALANFARLPAGYLRTDGVHPTADGYQAMAREAYEPVAAWLTLPNPPATYTRTGTCH